MRSPRYYTNQLYLTVAIKMLERIQFRSFTNTTFLQERTGLVKRLRQCL
jgi:hypothetical protein